MNKIRSWIEFAKRKPGEALVVGVLVVAAIAYGGTKPPSPPVVTEEGIKLTGTAVEPSGVNLAWSTEDPRVKPGKTEFVIEFRKRPVMLGDTAVVSVDDLKWKELGRTYDMVFSREMYLLDSTYEFRVRADVTEASE